MMKVVVTYSYFLDQESLSYRTVSGLSVQVEGGRRKAEGDIKRFSALSLYLSLALYQSLFFIKCTSSCRVSYTHLTLPTTPYV